MAKKKGKKRKQAKKTKPIENGRDPKGKFAEGNQLSAGKHKLTIISQTRALKQALVDAVNEKDIGKIAKKLVTQAKKGDIPAAKELFDRLWGKSMQIHEVEVDAGERFQNFMDWLIGRNGSNGHGSPDQG